MQSACISIVRHSTSSTFAHVTQLSAALPTRSQAHHQCAATVSQNPTRSVSALGTSPLHSASSTNRRVSSRSSSGSRRFGKCVCAADGGKGNAGKDEEKTPVWAEPGSSVPPPWAKEGDKGQLQSDSSRPFELPFGLYLLFSVFTGIATVGSIFELTARNPLFGVIPPESPLWAPVLLFFAVTGFPSSAFLLFKAVSGFNAFADEDDRRAGL